jgi:hypothetical protein
VAAVDVRQHARRDDRAGADSDADAEHAAEVVVHALDQALAAIDQRLRASLHALVALDHGALGVEDARVEVVGIVARVRALSA